MTDTKPDIVGIEPPDLGIPNVLLFGGIKIGYDSQYDGEFVEYSAMVGLINETLLAICSCDVEFTKKHIQAICLEFEFSNKVLAEKFNTSVVMIKAWKFGEAICPKNVQTQLKLMARTIMEPDIPLIQFIADMNKKAPEKFHFTYDEKTNKWTWSNKP